MAVPSLYRWIVVGSLSIRNRANSPHYAPEWQFADLCEAINGRIVLGSQFRSYGKDSRLMWCSKIAEDDDFVRLIVEVGDKNVTGVSFLNFETHQTRDVDKDEEEGGHYAAHILIKKNPDANGKHLILIEKVPSIHLASVKEHFAWICNDPAFEKVVNGDDGRPKSFRAIFEIDGHQSKTIREALRTGSLQDIEFVSHEEAHEDGLDEESIIREVMHQAKWQIKRRVSEDEARGLFGKIGAFIRNFGAKGADKGVFIRIKTDNGQIRRTEIERDGDEILEQAFVANEAVNDFERPLPNRYLDFHAQMILKMKEIADRLDD